MEEISHRCYTVGNILDQNASSNKKYESLARADYYESLIIPIKEAIENGCASVWEISEQTGIPEETILEIISYCDKIGYELRKAE